MKIRSLFLRLHGDAERISIASIGEFLVNVDSARDAIAALHKSSMDGSRVMKCLGEGGFGQVVLS